MIRMENLKIVNFPLHMMVKDIMDVQQRVVHPAPGVPQKLIQREIM